MFSTTLFKGFFYLVPEKFAPPSAESNEGVERIVAFSDAVFAFAITLLALDLGIPDLGANRTNAALYAALVAQTPHLLSFALSFWIIAVFWISHHRYFRYIKRYDRGLVIINFLMLFTISLMPFTTKIEGENGDLFVANAVYSLNMILLGATYAWTWHHASVNHHLVDPDMDDRIIRVFQIRSFATSVVGILVLVASYFIGSYANVGWFLIFVLQSLIHRYYKIPAV